MKNVFEWMEMGYLQTMNNSEDCWRTPCGIAHHNVPYFITSKASNPYHIPVCPPICLSSSVMFTNLELITAFGFVNIIYTTVGSD